MLVNAFWLISSFMVMELVAWFTHKYVMHGFLWVLHRDHHQKNRDALMERNDFFFLLFATPGILLIYLGAQNGLYDGRLWIGIGISLYGLAYVLTHDIFIHQRVRLLKHTDNAYLRAIRKAHRVHHKNLTKEDGECFGMLWVPLRYFRETVVKSW